MLLSLCFQGRGGSVLRQAIRRGEGRQFEVEVLEFRVRDGFCCRAQMVCGGGREWFCFRRLGGNERQGRHFHGESIDRAASGSAGLRQKIALVQSQARGPGRACRYEYKPSVAQVCEVTLSGQRSGQVVAKLSVQQIQNTCSFRERVEGDALCDRHQRASSLFAGWRTSLHGRTHSANSQ